MFSMRQYRVLIGLVMVWNFIGMFVPAIEAASCKVLVVMSYEEINPWCIEIKEGVDSALANTCELTYFYMDTKINLEGGKEKAKEAYSLLRELQPDGVITADDNAQWMFVLPYLKDKVDMPVMFCGVNAEAAKYGYPASNVSGTLERGHIRESIAFAKQLVPSIKTVGFLAKESPSGKALLRQVKTESGTYAAKVTTFELVRTVKELVAAGKKLKEQCDVIYMDSVEGIFDEEGRPLENKEIVHVLSKVFDKPIIGANQYHVEQGALCAVVKTGQEQGRTAANMLLKAIQGTAVNELPITRNYKGRRVINVTVMETLGIKPRPIVLLGAKLVRTEK
jgi:ABC-type uncharacterized transport system substrate-binding protein